VSRHSHEYIHIHSHADTWQSGSYDYGGDNGSWQTCIMVGGGRSVQGICWSRVVARLSEMATDRSLKKVEVKKKKRVQKEKMRQ